MLKQIVLLGLVFLTMASLVSATQTLCFTMSDAQYTKLITAYASNYHWKPTMDVNPVQFTRAVMVRQFTREVNRYDLLMYRMNLTGPVIT
jgi:hypothetical protein